MGTKRVSNARTRFRHPTTSNTVEMMIRAALPNDVPILVQLIRDLAAYERALDEVRITEEVLGEALFAPEPGLFARVAVSGDDVLGMALYHRNFSTWTGTAGIYLEDLYVRPDHRGRGVGRSLLVELARLAVQMDWRRVEWSVLDWNESAIEFYRSIGAVAMDEWTRYRLAGDALRDFAGASEVDESPLGNDQRMTP